MIHLMKTDMPITQQAIDELRRLEREATEGKWFYLAGDMGNIHIVTEEVEREWYSMSRERKSMQTIFYLDDERNGWGEAELICSMRNNLIPLLDELERLERENENLRKGLACIANTAGSIKLGFPVSDEDVKKALNDEL